MKFVERSPIETGFSGIFEARVLPRMTELEAERSSRLTKATRNIALVVAVAVVAGVLGVMFVDGDWGIGIGVLAGVGSFIAGIALWSSAAGGWKSAVAGTLMPYVCAHVGDLEYSEKGDDFNVEALLDLRLLPKFSNKTLSHLLRGTHHGTNYEMVHAALTKKGNSDNDSDNVVFNGLLFRIDVPNPAPGRIALMRDRGRMGNKLAETLAFGSTRSWPKVAFDHGAFEEAFEVYADDPEAARAYMPDALLDALLAIGKEHGEGMGSYVAGFERGSFYIALARTKPFMRMGGLTVPVADMGDDLHAIFDDIALSHSVIDRLHNI